MYEITLRPKINVVAVFNCPKNQSRKFTGAPTADAPFCEGLIFTLLSFAASPSTMVLLCPTLAATRVIDRAANIIVLKYIYRLTIGTICGPKGELLTFYILPDDY